MKYNKIQERVYDSKDLQFRAVEGDNDENVLEGYAALYNVRSKLLYDSFYEVIEKGAFDNVLRSKDLDVIMSFNHDNSLIMGRTTNETLKLNSDETGLFFRAVLPDTTYANDVYELVKRGDIFQNSFAFLPSKTGYKSEELDDGKELYTVTDVETLRDVSSVTFPAYTETNVEARDDGEGKEADKNNLEREQLDMSIKILKIKNKL